MVHLQALMEYWLRLDLKATLRQVMKVKVVINSQTEEVKPLSADQTRRLAEPQVDIR